jgi:hypothetical protein
MRDILLAKDLKVGMVVTLPNWKLPRKILAIYESLASHTDDNGKTRENTLLRIVFEFEESVLYFGKIARFKRYQDLEEN